MKKGSSWKATAWKITKAVGLVLIVVTAYRTVENGKLTIPFVG